MSGRARNAYAAPSWAAEQRVGDVGMKATLLTLANYADENFSCFPSQRTLAEETEQSERTVRRQVEVMEEVGLIRRQKRYAGQGHRNSDRYHLNLDLVVTVRDVDAAKKRLAAKAEARRADLAKGALTATLSGSQTGANVA